LSRWTGWVLFLCLTVPGFARADRPSAVLVVKNPNASEDTRRDALRESLSQEWNLREDVELRNVLEGPSQAENQVADALNRARQSLRRFKLDDARAALAQAREAVNGLAPTQRARGLAVEIAVREAEVALVEKDTVEVARQLGTALAIEPALQLDADLYSPPLIAQLKKARQRLEQARRISLKVNTLPSGARIFAAGVERCCTPLALELREGWQVLWAQRDGSWPLLHRLQVSTPGALSLPLRAQPTARRVQPLVDTLRLTPVTEELSAAQALIEELGVEAVLVVEDGVEGVRIHRRSAQRALPNGLAADTAQGVSASSGEWLRRWPVWATAAAAAGFTVAGVIAGRNARAEAQRAEAQIFASDGKALHSNAVGGAQWANRLYAVAAVAGTTSVILFFTF